MTSPAPTSLNYRRSSRLLEVQFPDTGLTVISAELLRVMSPSAEVQGHGPGQETLQTGKATVDIIGIESIGHYAVQISFNDGHSSGLYTWAYLAHLAANKTSLWQHYLRRLEQAGASRDPDIDAVTIIE